VLVAFLAAVLGAAAVPDGTEQLFALILKQPTDLGGQVLAQAGTVLVAETAAAEDPRAAVGAVAVGGAGRRPGFVSHDDRGGRSAEVVARVLGDVTAVFGGGQKTRAADFRGCVVLERIGSCVSGAPSFIIFIPPRSPFF
jgi:hypothetical protein